MNIRHTLLSGWLLVCLLLVGQFSLLLHETDHTGMTATGPCLVCLNHTVYEGAAPAPKQLIRLTFATDDPVEYVSAPQSNHYLLISPEPRAPPRYS